MVLIDLYLLWVATVRASLALISAQEHGVLTPSRRLVDPIRWYRHALATNAEATSRGRGPALRSDAEVGERAVARTRLACLGRACKPVGAARPG